MWPTDLDLEGAALSLIRLAQVYGVYPHTKSPLTSTCCQGNTTQDGASQNIHNNVAFWFQDMRNNVDTNNQDGCRLASINRLNLTSEDLNIREKVSGVRLGEEVGQCLPEIPEVVTLTSSDLTFVSEVARRFNFRSDVITWEFLARLARENLSVGDAWRDGRFQGEIHGERHGEITLLDNSSTF